MKKNGGDPSKKPKHRHGKKEPIITLHPLNSYVQPYE
jgi:hypothetical protein